MLLLIKFNKLFIDVEIVQSPLRLLDDAELRARSVERTRRRVLHQLPVRSHPLRMGRLHGPRPHE